MAKESDLQADIIKYLKKKGCYVLKTTPGAGVPRGAPDIFFTLEGLWGAIEVKASKKARFQPGQKETVAKLDEWSWAKVVWPENWKDIKKDLEELLR